MSSFVSAEAISSNIVRSQVYVGSRSVDYGKLCSQFTGLTESDPVRLPNEHRVNLLRGGEVYISAPDGSGKLFGSWTQFAAYYLAKFW